MATWKSKNSMLTKKGVEILNKLKAGIGSITVTRVVAGSERVAESLLYNQTSISGVNKDMTISFKNTTDVGSEISCYIDNSGFTDYYDLHQIGIYVTHPDYEGEQLYHISQCEANDFDTIPPIAYTPVTQGYSIFMEHGNAEQVTITVDPMGMVSLEQFNAFKESSNSSFTEINSSLSEMGNAISDMENSLSEMNNSLTSVSEIANAAKEVTDSAGKSGGLATLDENGKLKEMPSATDVGAIPVTQKGVANGVATLDANGKLKEMPNLADVGGSNENLLDNWYFADPIDQRQGYIVPPDTPYYSDTSLSAQVGTVSEYTTAVKVNDTYGTITVSGTTYYVAWSAAMRGYISGNDLTYTIDRWKNYNAILKINSGYINWTSKKESLYKRMIQFLDFPLKANKAYTMSVLAKINDISGSVKLRPANKYASIPGATGKILSSVTDKFEIFSYTFVPQIDIDISTFDLLCGQSDTDYIDMDIIAWKLEIGTYQTLAHQDENGNWILNDPPPDKNMELLKCCMSTADSSDTYANNKKTSEVIGSIPATQKGVANGVATLNGNGKVNDSQVPDNLVKIVDFWGFTEQQRHDMVVAEPVYGSGSKYITINTWDTGVWDSEPFKPPVPASFWDIIICYSNQGCSQIWISHHYGMFINRYDPEARGWQGWKEYLPSDKSYKPNLLHNWYFENPVNNNGLTQYGSGIGKHGITIDRWTYSGDNITLTLTKDGIVAASSLSQYQYIQQVIDIPPDLTDVKLVASVLANSSTKLNLGIFDYSSGVLGASITSVSGNLENNSGVLSCSFVLAGNITKIAFLIYPNFVETEETLSTTLIAAKLEKGQIQTLAYKDPAGNWKLNQVPDYSEQSAICAQYEYTENPNTFRGSARPFSFIQNYTNSITLDLSNMGNHIGISSDSDLTVTIPSKSTVNFPIGAELEVCRYGTGAVTFAAAEGVNINSVDGARSISAQFACAALKKVATDVWLLSGSLE